MRAVVQRVKNAGVTIDGENISEIGKGLLILIGITQGDTEADIDYIVSKCTNLRIFDDEDGVMNLSGADTGAEVLVVSQFTLYGDARKGRRPSYINALAPSEAEPVYEKAVEAFRKTGLTVKTGRFGAEMDVRLVNDGPVTILLDSRKGF